MDARPTANAQPRRSLAVLALALALLIRTLIPFGAGADGRLDDGAVPPETLSLDYREEMRRLVERLATVARAHRPGFVVVAAGGLELLSKAGDGEPPETAPAMRYLRSIDGVLVDPIDLARHATPPALIALARHHGQKVLVVDRAAAAESPPFVPAAADARGVAIAAPAPLPRSPFGEHPASVISLPAVANFLAVSGSSAYGREDEFAFAVHRTNFDLVVIDPFHGRKPLGSRAVETLRFKNLGARRLVLARLDIGTAASYLPYWQPAWTALAPPWIGAPVAGDPDRFHVDYWAPDWRELVAGDSGSLVYGLVAQCYDGVVLDGLESYRYFEGDAP